MPRLPRGKFTFAQSPRMRTTATSYVSAVCSANLYVSSQCLFPVSGSLTLTPKSLTYPWYFSFGGGGQVAAEKSASSRGCSGRMHASFQTQRQSDGGAPRRFGSGEGWWLDPGIPLTPDVGCRRCAGGTPLQWGGGVEIFPGKWSRPLKFKVQSVRRL